VASSAFCGPFLKKRLKIQGIRSNFANILREAYRLQKGEKRLVSVNQEAGPTQKRKLMIEAVKRILVVDDEPEFVNSIKRHLKREGFILDSAPDGEDARLTIRNSAYNGAPYDLVITDVIMPNTGGIELLHWIKKNHPEISVLVVSAFGDTDVVMETIRPGIDDYCKKPLTPEEMMGLIGSVNRKRRLRRCQQEIEQ